MALLPGVFAEEWCAAPSFGGGCGLLLMQSARTLGGGNVVFGFGGLSLRKETGDAARTVEYPQIFAVPVTYGLTDEIDITAAVYGYRDARALLDPEDVSAGYGAPGAGVGASYLGVKIRLPLPAESRVQIAGCFGGVLDTSREELDGMNYVWTRQGTDIECALYETFRLAPFLSLHLEQGYAISGSRLYDDQIFGAAGFELDVRDRVRLGVEIDNRTFLAVSPQSAFWAGANPSAYSPGTAVPAFLNDTGADFYRDYLVVCPSVSLRMNDRVTVIVGAAYNLADQAPPRERYQIIAGISFRTDVLAALDSDHDGVSNRLDAENRTPAGYPVDVRGVAIDTDGDGVPDGRDREGDTPRGAVADRDGVGRDTDGDGVCDGIDMEAQTPPGAPVDRFGVAVDGDHDGIPDDRDCEVATPRGAVTDRDGVAFDRDGDGVPDGIDVESDSPAGARVDLAGASLDGDGDGVPDGLDEEMNTPRGALTDRRGRTLAKGESEFGGGNRVRLNSVRFDGGRITPGPDAFPALDEIGRLLRNYPLLRIQIEGHTDNAGERESNYRVSRERANAVLEYLLKQFPELSRERFRVVGFGADKPVAGNATPEGRRENRRVDFVIISGHDPWQVNAGE